MTTKQVEKLESVLERIRTHPEFSHKLIDNAKHSIGMDALSHSLRIEGIGDRIAKGLDLTKTERHNFNTYFHAILKARRYLLDEGITRNTIAALGQMVEPNGHPLGYFRSKDVMFGEFEGALPHDIPYKVDDLVYRTHNLDEYHPIQRAVDLHLSLVQIHPYQDGNGRSARLCQDVFLESNGYPVPIIKEGEKDFYISLMRNAMRDRQRGSTIHEPSSSEELLGEFITSKILQSALDLEEEVSKQRIYSLGVNRHIDDARKIAQSLRRRFKGQGTPVSVKISEGDRRSQTQLEVKGNIPKRQLELVMNRMRSKRDFRYSIN